MFVNLNKVSNKKQNRSIYGFLNIKTGKEHSFKTQKQNMFIAADILKELRKVLISPGYTELAGKRKINRKIL